jgi:hypothetical protein
MRFSSPIVVQQMFADRLSIVENRRSTLALAQHTTFVLIVDSLKRR